MRGGQVTATTPVAAPVAATATATTQVFTPEAAGSATQVMTQPVGAGGVPPWQATPTGQQPVAPEEDEGKSHKALVWTLVAVAVAAIVAIVLILLLSNGDKQPPVTTVTMPTVAGLTQDQAQAALTKAGITSTPTTTTEASTDVDKGLVISSDPDEGATLSPDDPVSLVISGGPSELTVQDVSGLDQDQAVELLTAQGLVVNANHEFEDSPDVPKNRVTRTDPEAGAEAKQGDTVTLYISSGMVEVEDLTGKKEADATAILQKLKLSYKTETVETDDVKPGRVVSQSPDAGKVDQFSQVTLTIAKKPEPKSFPLPDLSGMTEAAAQTKLSDLKLTWDESTYENSDDVKTGQVIRTEPGANQQVTEGDTVHLVVSSGPATTTPPDGGGGDDGGDGGTTPTPPDAGDDGGTAQG